MCLTKIEEAIYKCRPSACRVFGNGAGNGVGGVYVRRTRGLYMAGASLQSSLDLAVSLSLIVCHVSVGLTSDQDFCVEDGSPVVKSNEETRPVWKKSGRVFSRM